MHILQTISYKSHLTLIISLPLAPSHFAFIAMQFSFSYYFHFLYSSVKTDTVPCSSFSYRQFFACNRSTINTYDCMLFLHLNDK